MHRASCISRHCSPSLWIVTNACVFSVNAMLIAFYMRYHHDRLPFATASMAKSMFVATLGLFAGCSIAQNVGEGHGGEEAGKLSVQTFLFNYFGPHLLLWSSVSLASAAAGAAGIARLPCGQLLTGLLGPGCNHRRCLSKASRINAKVPRPQKSDSSKADLECQEGSAHDIHSSASLPPGVVQSNL